MADPSGPTVSDQTDDPDAPTSAGATEAGTSDASGVSGGAAPEATEVPATGTTEPASSTDGDGARDGAAADVETVTPNGEAAGATSLTTTDADDRAGMGSVDDLDDDLDDDRDEDDADDDGGGGGKEGGGSLLTRQVQIDARTILIIVAVFAIGVGAYVLGQKQARDAEPTATTPTSAPPGTGFTVPKDFVPFDDKETGIKLAIPKDWVAYSTRDLDRSYRLLVGVPNAKDNLRVRMNAYSTAVTPENIKDQQAVVDAIFAQEKIEILAREVPSVNGLPALYYVYKFTDAEGKPGYHAHFFVFQGKKMVSLVFEAVPEDRFQLLAPTFDQIANSLQVAPGDPPAFLVEATGSGATGPATTTLPAAPPSSTP